MKMSIFEIFRKESLFPTLSSFSALQFVSLTKLEVCSLYFGHLQYSVCALYFKVWVIIILSTFWNMAFWHNCKLHSVMEGGSTSMQSSPKTFAFANFGGNLQKAKNPEILQFLKVCHSINVTAVECYQLKKGQSIISSLSHILSKPIHFGCEIFLFHKRD